MAWSIFAFISIFLMLLMTFGVVIQYASSVRIKYVDKTLVLGFTSIMVGAILWILFGYDLSILGKFWTGFERFKDYDYVLNMLVEMFFFLYAVTMVFGSVLERVSTKFILAFITIWMILVYFPLANYMWGSEGLFFNLREYLPAYDFSGGLVVHTSAGLAALVLCQGLRPRKENNEDYAWQKILTLIAGLFIIVGWFCFNMAPVKDFNQESIKVLLNTIIFVLFGSLSGFTAQYIIDGEYSSGALVSGAITGLVSSTTGVGYISIIQSVIIAIIVPFVIPFCIKFINERFSFDDAVDSFAMNGLGGIFGAFLAGIFIDKGTHFLSHTIFILITIVWSYLGALLIKKLLEKLIRFEEEEINND